MPITLAVPPRPSIPTSSRSSNGSRSRPSGTTSRTVSRIPALQRQVGTARIIGRAVTVRTTATDSTLLHHAAGLPRARRTCSSSTPAATAAMPRSDSWSPPRRAARGARGIVVDGVITDVDEIAALGYPGLRYGTQRAHHEAFTGIEAGGHHRRRRRRGGVGRPLRATSCSPTRTASSSRPSTCIESIIDLALQDYAEEPSSVAALRTGAPLGD